MNRYCETMRGIALLACMLGLPLSAAQDDSAATQPATRPGPQSATTDSDEFGDDIDLLDLEIPVIVSAGRRKQKITNVPYAISVITSEDIRRFGARSVPDALRLAAGVDVAELGFGSAAVSPRGNHGFISRQVLVLVDGRQIYDSWFGGTLWGSWPFQIEDIERIEVIRGPAGVAWGANAVHGVINIITKDPRDQSGLTISTGAGSRGTQREHIGYAQGDDKLRFRISGEYERADGFKRGGSIVRNLDDDYAAARIGFHLIYEPDDRDRFLLSAGHASLDQGYSAPPLSGIGAFRRSGSQASFILGRWHREIEADNSFDLTAYVNDFWASNGQKAVDYRYQQIALQFSHTFKPSQAHTVTWGVDTRADIYNAGNASPQQVSKSSVNTGIIGIYAQDDWLLAPRWTLHLGGRIDYEFYGGFEPSGRIALSYQLADDAMIYGAVSRAFQMPPAAIRFTKFPLLNRAGFITVDRGLGNQSVIAYELGYRAHLFERLDFNLNFSWMEDKRIAVLHSRFGPPGLLHFNAESDGRSGQYEIELEWRYRLTEDVLLLGNYAYTQSRWKSSVPADRTSASSTPKHKLMLGARYSPTDDLHFSAHAFWVDAVSATGPLNPFSARRIDPYWRLDLRAEYEFWNDRATLGVGVKNLLDNHHPEGVTQFINDAEVPRMVFAELRFALD